MSINFSVVQEKLILWAKMNTGLYYAIWADQNAPQPYDTSELKSSDAYVILRIQLDEQIGEDFVAPPDDSGNILISGNREFMLYTEIKGINAQLKMSKLRDSFQKPSVQGLLSVSKIAYVNNFPIQNITGLDDTQYIQRASMDVLLRSVSEIIDNVGFIEKVDITGTINDVEQGTFRVE